MILKKTLKDWQADIETRLEDINDDMTRSYYLGQKVLIEDLIYNNINSLEKIFECQANLQKKVGTTFDVPFAKDMTLSLIDELCESLHELPAKNWSKRHLKMRANGINFLDRDKYCVELIDGLHFLVNLFLFAGMTADDVWEAYYKKNQINFERQDSNY